MDFSLQMELQDKKRLTLGKLREMIEPAGILDIAIGHFRNKQYSEAIIQFQKFLSTYKESPWRGSVEKLMAKATEALSKRPPTSILNRSPYSQLRIYAQAGELEKLLEEAEKAMEADYRDRYMPLFILIQDTNKK